MAGLVGIMIFMIGNQLRREPKRNYAAPTAPLHPASVRVNFNSDPDGAVVTLADGKTLGLTPLSTEIPYSDSAVEFVFKKQGYETKSMYVVPNLPSPLFANLRRIEVEPEAASRLPPSHCRLRGLSPPEARRRPRAYAHAQARTTRRRRRRSRAEYSLRSGTLRGFQTSREGLARAKLGLPHADSATPQAQTRLRPLALAS